MNQMAIDFSQDPPHHHSTCPHCKQKIRKLNPHRMDASKVMMLEYLGKAFASGENEGGWTQIKSGRIPGFRGDEQVHAMRLEWFGLSEHGPRRSGLYRITRAGIDFLRGEGVVPMVIWCKEGQVIERDTIMVTISSVRNLVLDKAYWDNYPAITRDSPWPSDGMESL